MRKIIIGSRGSELALAQTNMMAARLRAVAPEAEVVIEIITTKGDKITDTPLAKIGGKGLFTKELENALLDRSVDLAVHSLKDLPTELPEGLCLACVPEREDPRDALITRNGLGWDALPPGARVGTSSLRRKVQLLAVRPDLEIVDLRGNVPTRIKKLETQGLDAIVLACAGLNRLALSAHITQALPPEVMLSAVGQGALGLETRSDDTELREILARLHDAATFAEVRAERTLLTALGGGCQTPLAALGRAKGDLLTLRACIASANGDTVLRTELSGPVDAPEELGRAVAAEFLRQGARAIIQRACSIAVHGEAPLRGKKIVVTRARKQAGGLAEELTALGAEVLALPTIEIVGRSPEQVPVPGAGDWVVFTSANVVEHYLRCLAERGHGVRTLAEANVCAIGPATAGALQRAGVPVSLTPPEFVAESLIETLHALEGGLSGKRFLVPRGSLARRVLLDALGAANATVEEVEVYETVRPQVDDTLIARVLAAKPDAVCLTSASTAENLRAILGAERLAQLAATTHFVSIGPLTTEAAEKTGIPIAATAPQHDVPGLIDTLLPLLRTP